MPANPPPPPPPPSPSVDVLKVYNDTLRESIRLANELGYVELANELKLKLQNSNIAEANKNLETQKTTLRLLKKEYQDITRSTASLVEDWQSILKSIKRIIENNKVLKSLSSKL